MTNTRISISHWPEDLRSLLTNTPGKADFYCTLFQQPVRIILPDRQSESFLTRALSHLRIPPAVRPALTICCRKSAEAPAIDRLWTGSKETEKSGEDIPFFDNGDFYISLHRAGSILSFLDLKQNAALFFAPEFDALPAAVTAAPFKDLLYRWLEEQNCHLIHGAGLAVDGQGILITGPGGSGKSTAAFRCLSAGLNYLGDDYVAVGKNSGYSLHSIYQTGKLDERSLTEMPHLRPGTWLPPDHPGQKTVILVESILPRTMEIQCPLKAIAIHRIDDNASPGICKISPRDAYLAMAPGTIFQQVGKKNKVSRMLADLCRTLPVFRITPGNDPEKLPLVIKDLLEGL